MQSGAFLARLQQRGAADLAIARPLLGCDPTGSERNRRPMASNGPSDIREGERCVDAPPPEDAQLRFIGRIGTPWKERTDCPRQGDVDGPDCRITLFEPWDQALLGLDAFEWAEILYWLDRSRRDLVWQSPRSDGRVRGTFALRSPVRPNPIGTSVVRIVQIAPPVVVVRGLDCLDQTPLLDIKPDRCAYTPLAPAKP